MPEPTPSYRGATLPTVSLDTAQAGPEQLREELVALLLREGSIQSPAVEAAVRRVPRHYFVPEVNVETAYANDAIDVVDVDGERISIASQPGAIAGMLEQDDIQPGHRVLEIGAGTGYNAALLATLAGTDGHVTTIDIHPDLVARTRSAMEKADIHNVEPILADGDAGHSPNAPYDRIVATVGSWDLSPAWFEQLADGGRLIIPLRIRGHSQRVVVFERRGDHLASVDTKLSIYMPMRGAAGYGRHEFDLEPGGRVRLALHTEQTAPSSLANALSGPSTTTWTGVGFEVGTPFTGMELWLACEFDTFCQMQADTDAADLGLISSAQRWGNMAVHSDDTVAYLHFQQAKTGEEDGPVVYEVGVTAHGENAQGLARSLADAIQAWDQQHRGDEPAFTAYPGGSVTAEPEGYMFDRPRTPFTVTWP